MGFLFSKPSYLKIKITKYAGGFIFHHNGQYRKIIICAGHPDNSFTTVTTSTEKEYKEYGSFHTYNGESKNMFNVLNTYNPKKDNIEFILSRLETECDLKRFVGAWGAVTEWVKNVLNATANILSNIPSIVWTGIGMMIGCSNGPKQITG